MPNPPPPPPLFPILLLPVFTKNFALQVDVSLLSLGGVLLQDGGKGLQPVGYTSRTLNGAELHLSAFEKEVFMCVWGVEKVLQREFDLHIDNQAFTWLYAHLKQVGKIDRWIVCLNNFRFKTVHIKEKSKFIADCLPRMCDDNEFEWSATVPEDVQELEERKADECCELICTMSEIFTDFYKWQHEDEECIKIAEQVEQ
ncbi:hypothetical protein PR048_001535 [Dryococelus australis]|uniref:Reverse transcriptase RNase H-like domain-containing protein n=1 Tax=Dryococelus australis TaxID=614101 RepID=A0ABQ9IHM2_9NEOP|nr:hypothetical protein PR048_001535 [Dryococelus australis]